MLRKFEGKTLLIFRAMTQTMKFDFADRVMRLPPYLFAESTGRRSYFAMHR
jgi:hypothetical protein